MANQFVNLPAPAANGAGAWVDVSSFGALKTVATEKTSSRFQPFVTIECSNELVPTRKYSMVTLVAGDESTLEVACHWMRAVISNYRGGGAPTVEVGGTDDGTLFQQLAVPAGDGFGAGSDVSALGLFKTVQVGGDFRGQVNVEISEDAGTSYSNAFSFALSAGQSKVIAADFMRVKRNGVPQVSPGAPIVWVAACPPIGGGGGGGTTVRTFRHQVITGAGTSAGIDVAITPPMPDANYNVIVTMDACADELEFQSPHTANTANNVHIIPGADFADGDQIYITLIPFEVS